MFYFLSLQGGQKLVWSKIPAGRKSPDLLHFLIALIFLFQSCYEVCADKLIAKECGCMRPAFYEYYPVTQRNLTSCEINGRWSMIKIWGTQLTVILPFSIIEATLW